MCVVRDLNFSILNLNMKSFELCVPFEISTNLISLSLSQNISWAIVEMGHKSLLKQLPRQTPKTLFL